MTDSSQDLEKKPTNDDGIVPVMFVCGTIAVALFAIGGFQTLRDTLKKKQLGRMR